MASMPPEPPDGRQDDEGPDRPPDRPVDRPPIVLSEQDFVDPAADAPAADAPREETGAASPPSGRYVPRSWWSSPVNHEPYLMEAGRPPGPGFGGALLWMVGVGLIQVVATVIAVGVFAPELYVGAARGEELREEIQWSDDGRAGDEPSDKPDAARGKARELTDLSGEKIAQVMTTTQVVFLIASVLAIWLYYGRDLPRRAPPAPPAGRHLVIVLALALPLALFDGFLAEQVLALMKRLGPPSDAEPVIPAMELFAKMAETGSFGSLLFILAITPAIAEEIVFRGVVGRGLLARYGLVGGVLLTSLLFAIVHLNPAQSIGVIPIGIAMHVAYLATRSFWVPILMHFLNNSLPVLMMFSLEGVDAEAITREATPIGLPGALAALACVVTLTSLLWQSRIVYLDPDGRPLETAYPTVEPPPPDLPHTKVFRRPSPWLLAGSAISLVAFFAAAVRMAAAEAS